MKKKNNFFIPTKYIFAALAALCIVMMFASYTTGFAGETLGKMSGYVFVPFEMGINNIGGWIREKKDNLADLTVAQAKNEELQAQVDELIMENSRLMQSQYRLQEFEELYALDQGYEQFNKVAANIIATDSGNWFNTFVIDKGKNDGIEADMNVIAGSGLVGIVTKSGDNWAQVRSVIDDMSNVSAQVLSTSDLCFVKGDLQLMDQGLIRIEELKDPNDLAIQGEKIVTSHVSDKYHEGILIGYLNEVSLDSNNLTKSGTITPAVDFEHLHMVLVITDLKQTVEES
ncbi:MAG: rod shape-determining protein MreC [Lachnospiraceae bacterium]|nr:rod shape-determining protein MreC [Lachnospiraceae bacterium]